MAKPIGTIFVELDLDPSQFTKKQKEILQQSTSTTLLMEKNFRTLGTQSDLIFDATKKNIINAYNAIANSSKSSSAEIIRAEEAKNAKLKSLNEQQFSTQTSLLDKFKANWVAVSAGIVAAWYAVNKVVGSVSEIVMAAARYETLGIVMRVVGNNAGYTGEQMKSFATDLEKTGISMSGSRQALVRMAQAQLDLSKSAQLARIAQDAAVIGAMNSTDAFNQMVYGIQSANVRVLRTIGINVSFEESYQKVAAATGRVTTSFSEQEKAAIRLQAVLDAGPTIVGAYESAMETAGKQILSLERHFDNLKVLIGGVFTPALAEIVEIITGAVTDLNGELSVQGKEAIAIWGTNLRIGIISIEAEIMRLAMLLDKIGGTWTSIKWLFAAPGAAIGIENYKKMADAAIEANAEYERRYKETDKALEALALKQIALENSLTDAGKASAKASQDALEQKRIGLGLVAKAAEEAATKESSAAKVTMEAKKKADKEWETFAKKVALEIGKIEDKYWGEFAVKYETAYQLAKGNKEKEAVLNEWAASKSSEIVKEIKKDELKASEEILKAKKKDKNSEYLLIVNLAEQKRLSGWKEIDIANWISEATEKIDIKDFENKAKLIDKEIKKVAAMVEKEKESASSLAAMKVTIGKTGLDLEIAQIEAATSKKFATAQREYNEGKISYQDYMNQLAIASIEKEGKITKASEDSKKEIWKINKTLQNDLAKLTSDEYDIRKKALDDQTKLYIEKGADRLLAEKVNSLQTTKLMEETYKATGQMGAEWLARRKNELLEEYNYAVAKGADREVAEIALRQKLLNVDAEYWATRVNYSDNFSDGFKAALAKQLADQKTNAQLGLEIWNSVFGKGGALESTLQTFFVDMFKGQLKNAGDYFNSFKDVVLAAIAKMIAEWIAFQAVIKIGGLFGLETGTTTGTTSSAGGTVLSTAASIAAKAGYTQLAAYLAPAAVAAPAAAGGAGALWGAGTSAAALTGSSTAMVAGGGGAVVAAPAAAGAAPAAGGAGIAAGGAATAVGAVGAMLAFWYMSYMLGKGTGMWINPFAADEDAQSNLGIMAITQAKNQPWFDPKDPKQKSLVDIAATDPWFDPDNLYNLYVSQTGLIPTPESISIEGREYNWFVRQSHYIEAAQRATDWIDAHVKMKRSEEGDIWEVAAQGAIINEPYLAFSKSGRRLLMGEAGPEAIVPLGKMNNFDSDDIGRSIVKYIGLAGSGEDNNNGKEIHVHLHIDGKEITGTVVRGIRSGDPELIKYLRRAVA